MTRSVASVNCVRAADPSLALGALTVYHSRMGTSAPCSSAQRWASSYPASAWRKTPIARSYVVHSFLIASTDVTPIDID